MKYIRIITVFVVSMLMVAVRATGQDTAENNYVIVELVDGTQFDGYLASRIVRLDKEDVPKLKISDVFGGEPSEYTSDEVKRIVFPPDSSDSDSIVYESVLAELTIDFWKGPELTKQPVFMQKIYDGENINGYVRLILGAPGDIDRREYLYMPKDTQIAIPYWKQGFHFSTLQKTLKDFPDTKKMCKNKEIKKNDFYDSPGMVLPLMDEEYIPHGL